MTIPKAETLRVSAIAYLRDLGANEDADLLSRCKLEIGKTGQQYMGSTEVGLNITLRCRARDVGLFESSEIGWDLPSTAAVAIQEAIAAVLPAQLKVHDLKARSLLVDRDQFEQTELERLIESQIDVMIAVATGGPRIQSKNQDYIDRRDLIRSKLAVLDKNDPNRFDDLWAWYGRWSNGDLGSYQSRREFVRSLYRPLLEELAGAPSPNPSEPSREPTGWERVDRLVERIVAALAKAATEEECQTVGLLCRECTISLALAIFDPARHQAPDGAEISNTDAYRMLEAYFASELAGSENEALRRHAKASLSLANALQHKRTAKRKDAALCAEATRTVVNIVAIMSERR